MKPPCQALLARMRASGDERLWSWQVGTPACTRVHGRETGTPSMQTTGAARLPMHAPSPAAQPALHCRAVNAPLGRQLSPSNHTPPAPALQQHPHQASIRTHTFRGFAGTSSPSASPTTAISFSRYATLASLSCRASDVRGGRSFHLCSAGQAPLHSHGAAHCVACVVRATWSACHQHKGSGHWLHAH